MHAKPDYVFFFADTPRVRSVCNRNRVAAVLRAYRRNRRAYVVRRLPRGFSVTLASVGGRAATGVYVRTSA